MDSTHYSVTVLGEIWRNNIGAKFSKSSKCLACIIDAVGFVVPLTLNYSLIFFSVYTFAMVLA